MLQTPCGRAAGELFAKDYRNLFSSAGGSFIGGPVALLYSDSACSSKPVHLPVGATYTLPSPLRHETITHTLYLPPGYRVLLYGNFGPPVTIVGESMNALTPTSEIIKLMLANGGVEVRRLQTIVDQPWVEFQALFCTGQWQPTLAARLSDVDCDAVMAQAWNTAVRSQPCPDPTKAKLSEPCHGVWSCLRDGEDPKIVGPAGDLDVICHSARCRKEGYRMRSHRDRSCTATYCAGKLVGSDNPTTMVLPSGATVHCGGTEYVVGQPVAGTTPPPPPSSASGASPTPPIKDDEKDRVNITSKEEDENTGQGFLLADGYATLVAGGAFVATVILAYAVFKWAQRPTSVSAAAARVRQTTK